MGTVPIVPKFDKKTQENICDGIFSPSIPTLTPTFKETKACPTPHILTRGYTIRTRQPLLPISSSYQKIRLVKEDLSRIDGKRKKVSDMTDSNRMKYDQPVRSCVRVSIDNDQIRLAHRVRDDPKGIYLETYLCNHQNPIDFIFNLDSRWNSDFLISRKTKYIGSEHDIHSLTSDLKSLIYLYSSEGSSFCKWHHLTDETQSTFQFVTDCADNYQFVCLNPFWENEAVCISGQGRVVLVNGDEDRVVLTSESVSICEKQLLHSAFSNHHPRCLILCSESTCILKDVRSPNRCLKLFSKNDVTNGQHEYIRSIGRHYNTSDSFIQWFAFDSNFSAFDIRYSKTCQPWYASAHQLLYPPHLMSYLPLPNNNSLVILSDGQDVCLHRLSEKYGLQHRIIPDIRLTSASDLTSGYSQLLRPKHTNSAVEECVNCWTLTNDHAVVKNSFPISGMDVICSDKRVAIFLSLERIGMGLHLLDIENIDIRAGEDDNEVLGGNLQLADNWVGPEYNGTKKEWPPDYLRELLAFFTNYTDLTDHDEQINGSVDCLFPVTIVDEHYTPTIDPCLSKFIPIWDLRNASLSADYMRKYSKDTLVEKLMKQSKGHCCPSRYKETDDGKPLLSYEAIIDENLKYIREISKQASEVDDRIVLRILRPWFEKSAELKLNFIDSED